MPLEDHQGHVIIIVFSAQESTQISQYGSMDSLGIIMAVFVYNSQKSVITIFLA